MKKRIFASITLILLATVLFAPAAVRAQEPIIEVSTPFTGVVAEPGGNVSLELKVTNKSKESQQVDLVKPQAPAGWTVGYFTSFPELEVRQLFLLAEESQTINFKAQVPDTASAADYKFPLQLKTAAVTSSITATITILQQQAPTGGITAESQFLQLSGPSGTDFEFRVDLQNQFREDRAYDFTATPPQGWTVTIQPQFESKQIASISLKAQASQSINLTVTAPQRADPGDYPVEFTIRSAGAEKTLQFKVTIIGRYALSLATENQLLSMRATAGQPAPLNLRVINNGTAPLTGINLSSSEPTEWKVTLNPQRIAELKAGEEQQVAVEITPREKAIPGDYVMVVSASSQQASADMTLRVTVATATAWGIIGIIIVVVVIAALVGLFIRLGRR